MHPGSVLEGCPWGLSCVFPKGVEVPTPVRVNEGCHYDWDLTWEWALMQVVKFRRGHECGLCARVR